MAESESNQRLIDEADKARSATSGDLTVQRHSLAERIQLEKHLEKRQPTNPARVLRRNRIRYEQQ